MDSRFIPYEWNIFRDARRDATLEDVRARRRAGRALRIRASPGKKRRNTRIRLGSPSHHWLEKTPRSIKLDLQYIYGFLFLD
jgi:hypothetical protein